MGCLNSRKIYPDIDTVEKLEQLLKDKDKEIQRYLTNLNDNDSISDQSTLAKHLFISANLYLLMDFIKLNKSKIRKSNSLFDEMLDIIRKSFNEAHQKEFKNDVLNKHFEADIEGFLKKYR